MKWLTLDDIRQHTRLDYTDEDPVLELYGTAAEETILSVLNRSYQDLLEHYGDIPAPIRKATLMLVDLSYAERSPASTQNMSAVPYTFDLLVKPYMRLTIGDGCRQCPPQIVTLGSQTKILIAATLPDDLTMAEVDFAVVVYNDDKKDKNDWKTQLLMLMGKAIVIGVVTIGSLTGASTLIANVLNVQAFQQTQTQK